MDKLNSFTDAVKDIIMNCEMQPDAAEQINYSRMSGCMLVDLISYLNDMADLNDRSDLKDNLISTYNDLVSFSAATKTDFNNKFWDTSRIFGISTFYFLDNESDLSKYYKTLDWYNKVYR